MNRILKFFKDVFTGNVVKELKSTFVLVDLSKSYIVYYKDAMAFEKMGGGFVLLTGESDREVFSNINQIGDAMSKIAPLYEWTVQRD